MTRILWNFCPSYLGLNQLVTILMDVPLAALRANRKTLRVIERENSRWGNRDTPRLFRIGVRCTCRAIVRARRDLCKDAMPVDVISPRHSLAPLPKISCPAPCSFTKPTAPSTYAITLTGGPACRERVGTIRWGRDPRSRVF